VVAGISAGIIVLIVLAGVVVVVVLIFSAKKTVDWIQLRTQANADFHNNPMHEQRDKNATTPLTRVVKNDGCNIVYFNKPSNYLC